MISTLTILAAILCQTSLKHPLVLNVSSHVDCIRQVEKCVAKKEMLYRKEHQMRVCSSLTSDPIPRGKDCVDMPGQPDIDPSQYEGWVYECAK